MNINQADLIVNQLIAQKITKFCIAPGSRSTPLALAVAKQTNANITVHYDERGIGFYALGYSKASQLPAAIITTSGTACTNLAPAIMEAYESKTPLIVLTADRPQDLRGCGANQSTDQIKLFANTIRGQIDLSTNLNKQTIRSIIAQYVALSLQNPQGPVHINCPFEEPFDLFSKSPNQADPIPLILPTLVAPPMHTKAKRGIIFLGDIKTNPSPVLELAKKWKWPIFADLLSQARQTPTEEQIRHFNYLLDSKKLIKPDLILHFGERFISKRALESFPDTPLVHVSPYPSLQDPARRVCLRIQSDIEPFCKTFEADTDPDFLPLFQELDQEFETFLKLKFSQGFSQAHAIRNLPSSRPIFFGNSMPIRDADNFFFPDKAPPIFANRGVSGIDGNIATMAGIADALNTSILGFIGDQTALHDLNSLPLIKKHQILLIISNNFGGGIFDHLPIAKSPFLDQLFAASHPWNFEYAAKMFDIPYMQLKTWEDPLPPFGIVELITDRKQNHKFHQELIV